MRHAYGNADGDSNGYAYTDSDAYSHSNSYAYADSYANCDGNGYAYADSYGYCDSDSYAYTDRYAYSNGDAGSNNNAETKPDTKDISDTAASSVVRSGSEK